MVKRLNRRVTVRFDTTTHNKINRLLEDDSYCLSRGFNKSELLRKFVHSSISNYERNKGEITNNE